LADSVLPRGELLREIDTLRRDNQQLREQQIQTAAIARENDQLRSELGWQRLAPWKVKLANVVMRDPANWWGTVQIDLGSRDGLQPNQPVLTVDGLVGRVSAVSFVSSQVVLVGDPNCRVSALVEDSTHDMGVLMPVGPPDSSPFHDASLVQLGYLPSSANLKAGQEVITSGLGGVFPRGIPIGKVVDARSIGYGQATEADVKLNANLGALERVWVLFK
jgi:rod shape-determining protein MreC